jgi:predicted alpha/beta superfamily hydrolase
MHKRLILAAVAFAVAVAALAVVFLPRGQMRVLPPASNGDAYVLFVHTPDACTRASPCPALYLLDGAALLNTFRRISEEHARHGVIQPVVIVGIGYKDAAQTGSRRKFDFTPTFDRPRPGRATGGADAFLEVLRREIIPYAEAHFPIRRSFRGLAGHSYGGLFASYALTRAPDLFQCYMIVSPALWFDDYKIFELVDRTEAPQNRPMRIFLASDDAKEGSSAMAKDVVRLARSLSDDQPLTQLRLFPGTTHSGVVPHAARAGLPVLFPATGRAHANPKCALRVRHAACRLDG